MKTLWLAVFITDAVLVFLVIPFTMFYYEADQDKTADKRLKSSLMWVIVSAIICTVNLGILYGADITVRHLSSSTTNFPMFCIYGECLFTENLDSPYFLPRICCCSNNYCWISSFLASFIKRPKTVITGSQYSKEATELTKKARELKKAADSLHQEEKNGSEGKNWRKNVKAVEKIQLHFVKPLLILR
ncbi:LMBR1-like membrane protein [Dioscorea alata]|uniref:LMBR1-like membrane protein n=3 Tax=Dioscorea alata TaxID=55571 RepID=A0ACB7UEC3_DIOAL|nr:LMBR1-like membrane protein [Dioscorea alata]KAH7658653.1 LMBR1-like membrane protein [Dioscorea alata]KAH7658654.1 LMBR1-like membrane protein [Dioscorea alata]